MDSHIHMDKIFAIFLFFSEKNDSNYETVFIIFAHPKFSIKNVTIIHMIVSYRSCKLFIRSADRSIIDPVAVVARRQINAWQ